MCLYINSFHFKCMNPLIFYFYDFTIIFLLLDKPNLLLQGKKAKHKTEFHVKILPQKKKKSASEVC